MSLLRLPEIISSGKKYSFGFRTQIIMISLVAVLLTHPYQSAPMWFTRKDRFEDLNIARIIILID